MAHRLLIAVATLAAEHRLYVSQASVAVVNGPLFKFFFLCFIRMRVSTRTPPSALFAYFLSSLGDGVHTPIFSSSGLMIIHNLCLQLLLSFTPMFLGIY